MEEEVREESLKELRAAVSPKTKGGDCKFVVVVTATGVAVVTAAALVVVLVPKPRKGKATDEPEDGVWLLEKRDGMAAVVVVAPKLNMGGEVDLGAEAEAAVLAGGAVAAAREGRSTKGYHAGHKWH